MIMTDEDALICDLAETYGIYDYESLPIKTVATLAMGLREDSRIKLKMTGQTSIREELLLAEIADRIGAFLTVYGGKAPSITNVLLGIGQPVKNDKKEYMSFDTPEDFEKAWKGGVNDGD